MGTRGFLGVVAGGTEKISYNHFDSYPEALGAAVYETVSRWMKTGESELRHAQAHELRLVTQDTLPTPEQIELLRPLADQGVSTRDLSDWYVLLRRSQGDIDAILDTGYMLDAGDFPLDSLFCEWGYLIDFDAIKLEVYQGFQTQPPTAGRWAGRERIQGDERDNLLNENYYPVQRVAEWHLGKLPATTEQFLAEVQAAVKKADAERG